MKASEKSSATPFLPGVSELPDDPQLVEDVRLSNSNPTFTGEVAVRDWSRAKAICAAVVSGMGVVAAATKFRCSTRTVHNIVRILRERGELPPIVQHVMQRLDEIVDVGTEVWLRALEEGSISPGQIPIPILAAIDKKAQLQAGIVAGTGRTETEIKAADVEAAYRAARSAIPVSGLPSDDPSTVIHQVSDQMPDNARPDTAPDTAGARPGPSQECADPVLPVLPAEPGAGASSGARADSKGGGGGSLGAGGQPGRSHSGSQS